MIGATKTGIPLEWGPNQRDGKEHTEWHAPCGCAFHPKPSPHWHPCEAHSPERELSAKREGFVWEPIETAPRTGVSLLLYQPWRSGYDTRLIGHYANGWVIHDGRELWDVEPTHWMTLPEPPTEALNRRLD